jgi:hypothetical protein
VPEDNVARAWLLLEHLKLWRDWSSEKRSKFYGKVDMRNVALIGHSRGGEAIWNAAAFNRMRHFPDDATLNFDYGFAIRSLIAMATSDGLYRPTGRLMPLSDISYLTLQGGHDADASIFLGDRQYNRLQLASAEQFKASVYAYRANHGQFNTEWGDEDWSPPSSWMLNRSSLMPGEDQRRIAMVYVTAFLESTLKGNQRYLALFRDGRSGRAWLPQDLYITRYEDSRFRLLANFDEDVDVSSTTAPGGTLSGSRLTTWRELDVGFRDPEARRETNAVMLGWQRKRSPAEDPAPQFQFTLPPRFAADNGLNESSAFVFQLAAMEENLDAVLDLTIELVDVDGSTVRLPLSGFRPLLPPLIAHFSKGHITELISPMRASEPVFQTFELPLAVFAHADSRFHPEHLAIVRMVFDRTDAGVILLDQVGFSVL